MRPFTLVQLFLLSTTVWAFDGPSLTGNPGVLDAERSARLKGALRSRQASAQKLPVARKTVRNLKGPSKKGPKGPELFPTEEAIQLGDDFYDDEFWSDDNCKLVTFNETFFFFTASSSVAAGADTQAPGSMFIFNQPIYQLDGTEVPYVTLSGICTRTVTSDDAGLGGAGTCQLTFVDTTGNYTIATQGYLGLDANSASAMTAGSLVITGGSGSMVSVLGEMNVIPMDGDGMFLNGDVLADAYAYYVEAALGVIICPSPYHLDQYQY